MKQIFSVVSLGILFILGSFCAFSYTASEKITVTEISGAPEIIRQGQSMPASLGMTCQKNDQLKTTPQCSMDVALNGMAGCRVLPSSEVLIADASQNSMNIKVANGNVILNLQKLPKESTFKVETPTAIASVRGTQFWGRVDLQKAENPVTTFAVREGTVEILAKSLNKTFMVEKGSALDIPKDASVAPAIRAALPGELQAMEQADKIKTAG